MTKQQFRKWLEMEIAELNRLESDLDLPACVFERAAGTVRQAAREAALLGYPTVAGRCSACTTPALALQVARTMLAECLAAVECRADLLTVQQAAERVAASPKTIYSLVASGKLRCQRIGNGRGTIRIQPADLERMKNETKQNGFKHLRI